MLKNYKKKLVIGVIGLGVGAYHLNNSLKYKNCKVKYICDVDKKKLNFYKKKFNIQNTTRNFDKVINDKEVDAVIIATNDDDHFYQVTKALKNNKHIFVEKPICLSLKELKTIIEIKKNKPNLFISSNLVLRTHPFFERLLKNKKKLEKIYFIEGDYNYGRLDKLIYGWRGKINNYSVILGGGIHLLDIILKIKGKKVKEVYTLSNKIITKKFKSIPEDFAISLIKFEDDSIAKISSNFSSSTDHHHIFNIYSKNTSYFYNRNISKQYFKEKENKPKIEIKYKHDNKTKGKMLNNFLNVITRKTNKLIITENDLFYLMKICLMLVDSQRKNKIIKL